MSEEKIVNKKAIIVTVDGQEVKLAVKRPDLKTQQHGQLVYSREFARLVKPEDGGRGALVRVALDSVLRAQGLWDDAKQKEWEGFNKSLLEAEKRLAKGGIKLSEAKELAIQMRRDRYALRALLMQRNSMDLNTADAQAENARFNYYVSAVTVYSDTGKAFFKSEEDYANRANEDAAVKAAQALGNMLFGLDDNHEANLPENKFLVARGFARTGDLHLVNKAGQTIDARGRRVDEKGRLLNEKDELVDEDGNLLTEEGEYKVDFVDFIDDVNDPDVKTETLAVVASKAVSTETVPAEVATEAVAV